MAYSKVILNGTTLMDVTQDTVDAANLLSGETATKNSGAKVTGTYTPPTFSTQSKTVTPSTTSQTVQPDSGYDGLSSVTVNAMPSGSASTPATSITANPSISVSSGGLITATASASQSVTPTVSAGYVSTGTAGTVTVSGSNTQQLTTQSAQTITPTTQNQTIASGQYLTGAQTILGDANLLAENIKKDVSIFGVTGTLEGGGSTERYISPTMPQYMYHYSTVQTTDSGYDYSDVKAVGNPGSTMYIQTSSRWALDSVVRNDTHESIPFTTISYDRYYGGQYSFVMPDADVEYSLYNDD